MSSQSRVIVITGGAGTLGVALAKRLLAEAATSVVLSDLNVAALQRALESLGAPRERVMAFAANVTDQAAVDALVAEAVRAFGSLDVMINNAGILPPNARMHNLGADDWERNIRVNLMGVVHGITSAVRVMREKEGGSIINTASVAGLTAWPYSAPYGATKAAVIHLTKIAAVEYAKDNIRVNCVCPGLFESTLVHQLPEAAVKAGAARHPLGPGTAQDVVGAFAYLASEEARWTTGTAVVVDGGYSAP